jgi:membrane protein YqaA with SNARE-associated domain
MDLATLAVYSGLFATAFIAATIFPAQSEALLVGLMVTGKYSHVMLIAVATVGNTLGAAVNWYLGRGIEKFRNSKWFPATDAQLERAQSWYHRWGRWSLLLAWLPIGGDALTVVAGIMREPMPTFLLFVGAGKLARYLVVAAAVWGIWG